MKERLGDWLAIVVGGGLVLASWGPLSNLFSDYQDSPAWVYWVYGAVLLLPGVTLLGLGVRDLRRRTK